LEFISHNIIGNLANDVGYNNLSDDFKNQVAAARTSDDCNALLARFGTHVVENGDLGGVVHIRVTSISNATQTLSEQELEVAVKVKLGLFGASASLSTSTQQSVSTLNTQYTVELRYFGGDDQYQQSQLLAGAESQFDVNKHTQWVHSLHQQPVMLGCTLRSLYSPEYWQNNSQAVQMRSLFRFRMELSSFNTFSGVALLMTCPKCKSTRLKYGMGTGVGINIGELEAMYAPCEEPNCNGQRDVTSLYFTNCQFVLRIIEHDSRQHVYQLGTNIPIPRDAKAATVDLL